MDRAVLIQLAKGGIPPPVFALLLFGAIWLKAPKGESADPEKQDWRHRFGALFAVAIVLASWPIAFSLAFPPHEVFERIPWLYAGIALVLTTVAPLVISLRTRGIAKSMAGAALLDIPILLAGLLVFPALKGEPLQSTDFFVFLFVSLAMITPTLTHYPRLSSVLQLVSLVTVSQVLVLAFSSLKSSQAVGMLAEISGVLMVLTFWKKRDVTGELLRTFLNGAAAVTMFAAIQTSDVKRGWGYLALIFLAPLAGILAAAIPFKSAAVRRGLWIAAYLCAIGGALVLAIMNQPKMDYE